MLPKMNQYQDLESGIASTSSDHPVFNLIVSPPERGSTPPAPLPYTFDQTSRRNDRLAPGPPPPRPRRTRVAFNLEDRSCSRGLVYLQAGFVVVCIAATAFALGVVLYCNLKDLMNGQEVHMQH